MNTAELQDIMSWLRSTDLVEVAFREGDKGFSLTTASPQAIPESLPAARFAAVRSPGVGLFRWGALGEPRRAEEGASLSAGQPLGLVEAAKGKAEKVLSPCAGRLARIFIDAGEPVEFGQLLFFVESAG